METKWTQLVSFGKLLLSYQIPYSDQITNNTGYSDKTIPDGFFVAMDITIDLVIGPMVRYLMLGSFRCAVMAIWMATKSFTEQLTISMKEARSEISPQKKIHWSEISWRYQAIGELCELINETFGSVMCLNTMTIVLSLIVTLD